MTRTKSWLWLLIACTALLGSPAAGEQVPVKTERPEGQGSLEAVGPNGESLGGCPLEHTEVHAEVSGFVARVVVKQVFVNPFDDPIEAIYTFPLSDRGAVDAMWIRTGEREIRGEIKRREEARAIYEQARQDGKLAALLDQERPNIFTQSVANLMPGARVEIEIQYVETLVYEDGTFEWSFPMVVGPRFVPGTPTGQSGTGRIPDTTRVPDASRITPPLAPEGTRAGHDISVSVDLDAGVKIEKLDSRLHAIEVERDGDTRAQVRLARRHEIPNRDFVLRYDVAGDQVKSGVLTHRNGGDGYVTLILIPPKRVLPADAAPKELIFVIDRSGSQSGLPLLKAKETMLWTLEHLNPNDTFQIVSFSDGVQKLFREPRRATPDAVRQARRHIRSLEANGGTMMAEAVREVCAQPAADNRLRIVAFMTDGYVGNDFEVIDLVKRLRGRSRWFPFGTGNSVNRFLLEQMALQGGGEVEYVLLNEDGERVARKFWKRISSPVLTDIRLEFRNLDVEDVMPYELSDLWAQKPLIVHARYQKPGRGSVILRGFRGGEPFQQRIDVELPRKGEQNAGIASIWARARVDDLMARDLSGLQSGNYPEKLRDEIVDVALAHSIVTQFTSFVAVEDRVINENGVPRTITVPVELPHGVDRQGVLGAARAEEQLAFMSQARGRVGGKLARKMSAAYSLAAPAPPRAYAEARADREVDAARDAASPNELKNKKLLDKLGPHLRDLFEGRVPAVPYSYAADGTITVVVSTTRLAGELQAKLSAAGLRVTLTTDGSVVGAIELERLEDLLALAFVERVELR